MPLFGSHLSIAGGLHNALVCAAEYGFDAVQLFSKSPNQWAAKPITKEDATLFRRTRLQTRLRPIIVHDSYLINLASPEPTLWRRSVEAFVEEVQRCEAIGASYLVTHPGAHLGAGEEAGIARVVLALNEVHERCGDRKVRILLETTAGMGSTLGHRFEHLAAMIDGVEHPERLGVCLDTCHVFAAGYPLAPEAEYRKTMREFDRRVGLRRIKAFHVNDSKREFGSRVDRHAHIGRGHLGLEPFRLLLNDRRFRNRPMVLETPKEEGDKTDMDAVNLATLRNLMEGPANEMSSAG